MENKKEKNEEPVIIRRAVIINDEDEKQDKKQKDANTRRESAFEAQKPKNKDYNIVYRDKSTKPLTISELFGIPKKEKVAQPKENAEIKKETMPKPSSSEEKDVKKVTTTTKSSTQTLSTDKPNKIQKDNSSKPQFNKDRRAGTTGTKPQASQERKFDSRKNQGSIDRKIKDVVEIDVPTDKENTARDYTSNRLKDKQKQNRLDESRSSDTRNSGNSKRNNRRNNEDYDSGKLNSLKKHNKLSNMFHEDGEMLDYYDLSTEKKRNKKKQRNVY